MSARTPRTRTPRLWVEKIETLLRERGEVSFRLAVEEGMRYVPAGPAWREGAAKRRTDARYRNFGVDVEVDLSDTSALVRTGAQRIVLEAIRQEVLMGRFERLERDGRRMIRLGVSRIDT